MKKLLSILLLSAFIKLSAATGEIVTHKVQAGENLFRISLMYNSTIDDITAANPSTNLKAVKQGMTINVPKDTKVRDAAFVANILNNKSGSTATVPAATPAPVVKPIVAPKPQSKPAMAEATPTKQKEIAKTADKREAVKEESAFISIAALAKPVAASPKQVISGTPKPYTSVASEELKKINIPDEESFTGVEPVNMEAAPRHALEKTPKEAQEANFEKVIEVKGLTSSSSQQYQSSELQTRYNELKKIEMNTGAIKVVDPTTIRMDLANGTTKGAKALRHAMDNSNVAVINLQIVLKDGTIRSITTLEDQKRVLAQIMNGQPLN